MVELIYTKMHNTHVPEIIILPILRTEKLLDQWTRLATSADGWGQSVIVVKSNIQKIW